MLKNYKKRDFALLKEEEKEEKIVFHLLSDFIKDETLEKLKALEKELSVFYPTKIKIHILSDDDFQGFPKWGENYLSYFRLHIPNILKNVDSALYLDVDMLAFSDIRALWTLNLENITAAVIRDWNTTMLHPRKSLLGKENFVFKDFYFNSGFIFMNLEEFRKRNIKGIMFEFFKQYKVIYPDQDAFNYAIPKENAIILPFSFDFMSWCYYTKEIEYSINYSDSDMRFWTKNPVIMHFCGPWFKPWKNPFFIKTNSGEIIGSTYFAMVEKTPFFGKEIWNNLLDEAKKVFVSEILFQYTKNSFGLLKLPFVIQKIKIPTFNQKEALDYLQEYYENKDSTEIGNTEWLRQELLAKYEKAKGSGVLYLLKLPLAILFTKCKIRKWQVEQKKKREESEKE